MTSLLWCGILIGYAVCTWVVLRFCRRHLNGLRMKELSAVVLLFFCNVSMTVLYEIWNIPYMIYASLRHILFYGIVCFLFRETKEKVLLVTVLLITIQELVLSFSNSCLSCLAILVLRLTNQNMNIIFESWVGEGIAGFGLVFVILAISRLTEPIAAVFEHKTRKEYLALAMPVLFLIAIMDVVQFGASNGVMVVSGVVGAEYGRIWLNALFSHMAICLLTILLVCMAAGYIWGMERINREQRKKELYRSQVAFYQMLEEQYRKMEGLRHDMKNHVIAMWGLWKYQDWEKMGLYLEHMLENGQLGGGEEISGSKAVDALLYSKRKQAEEKHIVWECDARIPERCGIEEFDLCVILGNILDNALEACDRMEEDAHRWIHVQVHMIKSCLLFEVRNSTDLQSINEIPGTAKKQTGEHGIGLRNISETVQKYNGVTNAEVIKDEFVISVLLPFQDTVHDNKPTL